MPSSRGPLPAEPQIGGWVCRAAWRAAGRVSLVTSVLLLGHRGPRDLGDLLFQLGRLRPGAGTDIQQQSWDLSSVVLTPLPPLWVTSRCNGLSRIPQKGAYIAAVDEAFIHSFGKCLQNVWCMSFPGLPNKLPQSRWLKITEIYSCTFLEAKSPRC